MSRAHNSGALRIHSSYNRAAGWLQSPFLLLVRLYWGWQFTQKGWDKLHHLSYETHFFHSLGIPHPGLLAPFVSGVEFVGGILLILGLFSHITGLVLAIDMFVAYWTADHAALQSGLVDPSKFYGAHPFTFFFASLVILVFGAGFFSLDELFGWRRT